MLRGCVVFVVDALVVGGVVGTFEICVGYLFRWLRLACFAWDDGCLVKLLGFILVLVVVGVAMVFGVCCWLILLLVRGLIVGFGVVNVD